jgi:UDP-2,3-diacylglucosamine hydrolase
MERSKIYFASDAHLGYPSHADSLVREKKLVHWLSQARIDAKEIFLLGDIFDFWYEYKRVVPKGFTRLLGTIASITDEGIPVHFFSGNHDVWAFSYLADETGMKIHHEPYIAEFGGKKFFIAHGDGLGPGDPGYKILKSIFRSPVLQWLFSHLLHPDCAMRFGHRWSISSRNNKDNPPFMGEEKEQLIRFARQQLEKEPVDYFIFGHRHIPFDFTFNGANCRVINLGDWLEHFTYACFCDGTLCLKRFSGNLSSDERLPIS